MEDVGPPHCVCGYGPQRLGGLRRGRRNDRGPGRTGSTVCPGPGRACRGDVAGPVTLGSSRVDSSPFDEDLDAEPRTATWMIPPGQFLREVCISDLFQRAEPFTTLHPCMENLSTIRFHFGHTLIVQVH